MTWFWKSFWKVTYSRSRGGGWWANANILCSCSESATPLTAPSVLVRQWVQMRWFPIISGTVKVLNKRQNQDLLTRAAKTHSFVQWKVLVLLKQTLIPFCQILISFFELLKDLPLSSFYCFKNLQREIIVYFWGFGNLFLCRTRQKIF